MGQSITPSASTSQHTQAEEVLRKACLLLQQQGVASERTRSIIRVGTTADEIVKAARELHVSFIVVGSQGNSFKQRLRRFLIGSISRSVLQFAPCPVMIIAPPPTPKANNLVLWYENAIKQYLSEHAQALSIFTSLQTAQQFVPPNKKKAGRKEIAAATLALERLANDGMLFRHDVQGELRYVND